MAPTLGSILLASTNPARLRDWYVDVFEPKVDKTPDGAYDVLDLGGVWVMLDKRDDVGEHNPEPGRVILNIEVADAKEASARVDASGAKWLAPLEDRDGSFFATAIDPDGNYVQILQISEEHKAAMEAGS